MDLTQAQGTHQSREPWVFFSVRSHRLRNDVRNDIY